MALAALGTALFAVPPYLSGDSTNSKVPIDPDVAWHFATLAVHAVPGGLALALGPLQFATRIRARWPHLHRNMGKVYLVSVIIASLVSLWAALYSQNGLAAQVGFLILAVLWLVTAYCGYATIKRGDVKVHRIWMIRNYALTFSAVLLRVYLLVGVLIKRTLAPELPFDQIYTASVWAAILINIVGAEYVIVHRLTKPKLAAGASRVAADV